VHALALEIDLSTEFKEREGQIFQSLFNILEKFFSSPSSSSTLISQIDFGACNPFPTSMNSEKYRKSNPFSRTRAQCEINFFSLCSLFFSSRVEQNKDTQRVFENVR
jgi:hypothetical protein